MRKIYTMRIWIVLFFTISAIKLDFFSLKITKVKLRHKESFPPWQLSPGKLWKLYTANEARTLRWRAIETEVKAEGMDGCSLDGERRCCVKVCASYYQRDSRRFKTNVLSTRPGSNKAFLVTNTTRCFTIAATAISRSNWELIIGSYSQFLRTVLC